MLELDEVVLRVVVCIILFLLVRLFWVNLKVVGWRYRIRTDLNECPYV